MDNSCRWGYGFEPEGDEPGACFIPPTPTPTPTATPAPLPGTIQGTVYQDANSNQSKDGGEGGLAGATVSVRSGSCLGNVVASTTTGASGEFAFSGLAAGDYCVTVEYPTECGGWIPSTSTSRSVDLDPGETEGVLFGYPPYVC